jgi:hypothetical protein
MAAPADTGSSGPLAIDLPAQGLDFTGHERADRGARRENAASHLRRPSRPPAHVHSQDCRCVQSRIRDGAADQGCIGTDGLACGGAVEAHVRFGEFSTDSLQVTQRADLVDTHKSAVADHVAGKVGQPSFDRSLVCHPNEPPEGRDEKNNYGGSRGKGWAGSAQATT